MSVVRESFPEGENVYSSTAGLGPAQSLPSWVLAVRSACLGAAALLYAAALVFVRGRPTIKWDAGIFLSVAARLVHGAHLYTGVWDNKPPFFYYAQALAVDVAGWRGPFLLDVAWLFVATSSIWLLLGAIKASTWTRVIGTILYPCLLTGAWYYAGYAELPPLALATTMACLCFRGNMLATGALLAIVAFFRPDYGLVFLALIGAAMLWSPRRSGTLRQTSRILAGFVTVAAASVGVLAARGELAGYVSTIKGQVGYPDRALAILGWPTGLIGHVKIVRWLLFAYWPRGLALELVVTALLLILMADTLRRRHRGRTGPIAMAPLDALFLFSAAAAAVTLAVTALWGHSLELIALPATFGACVLVSRLDAVVRDRTWRVGMVVATAAVCALAFGGVSLEGTGGAWEGVPLSAWWHAPYSLSAAALNAEAAVIHRPSAVVTYARLGQNDDGGHAEFIDQDLKLACPVFHQYPFSSNLTQALACIRSDLPNLVLVSSSFHAYGRTSTQRWDKFVLDGERLLRKQYRQALRMSDHGTTVQVWARR